MNAWPSAAVPFAIDDLLDRGRALDHATRIGEIIDRAEAQEIVDSLAGYVASLPPDDQAGVARRLVEELAKRARFTSTVQPKAKRASEVSA